MSGIPPSPRDYRNYGAQILGYAQDVGIQTAATSLVSALQSLPQGHAHDVATGLLQVVLWPQAARADLAELNDGAGLLLESPTGRPPHVYTEAEEAALNAALQALANDQARLERQQLVLSAFDAGAAAERANDRTEATRQRVVAELLSGEGRCPP